MVNTMRSASGSARFSRPVRIGDVLTAAVPVYESIRDLVQLVIASF